MKTVVFIKILVVVVCMSFTSCKINQTKNGLKTGKWVIKKTLMNTTTTSIGRYKKDNKTGKWNAGDAFTADPPQEPQGLNTVFSEDKSTLGMIKNYNGKLR